jgi:AcrR family transcriptional regulator
VSSEESSRRAELIEAAYEYVLANGLADVSLRPIAQAIGSSTGVLRFLFGSRDRLVAALLERARADELAMLERLPPEGDLATVAAAVWGWLADPAHDAVLRLWTESYATSLRSESGPWAGFAKSTVRDWLAVLARAQPASIRNTAAGRAQRTAVLAILRGGLLDVLASRDTTRDQRRVTRAVMLSLAGVCSEMQNRSDSA